MSEHVIWKTKGGRSVRILCTDKPGEYPITGYFLDFDDPFTLDWRIDGRSFAVMLSDADLIIPEGAVIGISE